MIDEERRQALKALAREGFRQFMDRLDHRVCVECERPVREYHEVMRCVYAKPCGHRQYQGKAP